MTAAALLQSTSTFALSTFQERVHLTPEDHDLFLGGGRGGSKTWTIALLFLRHAEQYGSRARMLYVRQSFPGIVDFEQTCREVFGFVYGRAASYNAATHLWRFPNGATLQLDQLEGQADFAKFQGKNFSLIAVDEAGHYPDPAVLDLLRSCLRAPLPIQPRFIVAANPGGPGHGWLSRRHVFAATPWHPYIEANTKRRFINCPSVFTDNPFLDHNGYASQLDAATATDDELRRAWKCGDWSVARGAFFSSVLDEARVLIEPCEPDDVVRACAHYRDGWRLSLAHDFGVSAPSVTYIVGESPGIEGPGERYFPRGSIVLFDELATHEPNSLERGMGYTVPRLADEIKDLAKHWKTHPEGVADDSIFSRTGSGAGSLSDEFRRAGVFFRPARKGDRLSGWQKMRRMLADAAKPDKPGLYVSRRCAYWWNTVPTLARDPRRPDDVDTRSTDHAADATRYAIVGRIPTPVAATGRYRWG